MNKPTIGANAFVLRQTAESEFTHFEGSFETIARLAVEFFDDAKAGYKDGVCLIPVPAEGFYTGVVELSEGDALVGKYRARRPGEEPRKTSHAVGGEKSPAVAVDVVLYRKDVLAEGDEATTDCDWEIVSVNGRITEDEMPIHPDTLIANHFGLDGGTLTEMSPEEFEWRLEISVMFWKNKAMLEAPEVK